MRHLRIFLPSFILMWAFSASAKVTLPAFFSSNMVVQQNTDCRFWGTASKDKTVKVSASWDKKSYSATADSDGHWNMKIRTPKAGGPFTITFNDGEKTVLTNVMSGELWLCAGQSNMEMPMKGYNGQPVEGSADAIINSRNANIRLFNVKRVATIEPQSDVTGQWNEASPETVRNFSATAYFFGRMLQKALDVPVGLIVASWGGASCEAFMSRDMLKAFPQVVLPTSQTDADKKKQNCATALYNGMIHPLVGTTIAGTIWYQGEDNWPRYAYYADLFTTMVKSWREEWGEGDFPFYYCQIAPYDYRRITRAGQDTVNSAFLREQQLKAETMIPNSGMAVMMDIGLEKGIHPMKKQVSGERLARLALVKTYGMQGVTAESPRYSGMEIHQDTVVCNFDRAPMWINSKGTFESNAFELAGEDRVFHPAKAQIVRQRIIVKSKDVPHPVAVRYAFKDWTIGDIFGDDLPVSSFRSDNWDK